MNREDLDTYAPILVLTKHIGLLLAYHQQVIRLRGVPEKFKSEVVRITINNLIFGWWSPRSLFINPVITIANVINYFQYKDNYASFMDNPVGYINDAKISAQNAKLKAKKHSQNLLIILGILVAILIVFILTAVIASQ